MSQYTMFRFYCASSNKNYKIKRRECFLLAYAIRIVLTDYVGELVWLRVEKEYAVKWRMSEEVGIPSALTLFWTVKSASVSFMFLCFVDF